MTQDIVPVIPTNPPYYHPSPGYDIIKPTGQTPTANDITINPGISASEIGYTYNAAAIGPAHQWYFQNVTGCYVENVPVAQQVGIPTLGPICSQFHLGC
jgi:hypothetical protein